MTIFFFVFLVLVSPGIANADQSVGLQMTFSEAGTTIPTASRSFSIALSSTQQIESTSVQVRLDGQAISSGFEYKGHWEPVLEQDDVWVVDSYLEGTVSTWVANLHDGSHTLSVTAADISGVPKTMEWNFNVNVVPVFSSPTPTNGAETKNNNGFSVKVADNDGIDISSIHVSLDNNTVSANFDPGTGTISYFPTVGLSDGLHTINVAVTDFTGNKSTYTWSYTVKTVGPTLDFIQKNQTLNSYPNLTVNVSSNINLSDSGFVFKLDGQPLNAKFDYLGHWEPVFEQDDVWVVDNKQATITALSHPSLSNGLHTVEVTAKDYLGNESTQTWTFNLAMTSP